MRTYRRAMGHWWTRHAFYRWYMLRELSCVFITAYALVLLAGLYRLGQGAEAFAAWQAALAAPGWLVFHAATLALVTYHSWTWFKVMPKTLPRIPLPDWTVVAGGVGAATVATVVLLWAALG